MENQSITETIISQNISHTDVKENHSNNSNSNSTELVENYEIENTPFRIIGNEEEGYFTAFGKYRVSERYKTKEETEENFNVKPWEILINTITACIDFHKTLNN